VAHEEHRERLRGEPTPRREVVLDRLLHVREHSAAGRAAVAAQVDGVDADAEFRQTWNERAVSLDVALRVLAETVLQQQRGARSRRVPRVAPNAGADLPGAGADAAVQGARFAGASPR